MKTFTRKDGTAAIAFKRDELPETCRQALVKCDETYKANEAAKQALAAAMAKHASLPAGQAFEADFRYGNVNFTLVKVEPAKASGPATLADWLKTQVA